MEKPDSCHWRPPMLFAGMVAHLGVLCTGDTLYLAYRDLWGLRGGRMQLTRLRSNRFFSGQNQGGHPMNTPTLEFHAWPPCVTAVIRSILSSSRTAPQNPRKPALLGRIPIST